MMKRVIVMLTVVLGASFACAQERPGAPAAGERGASSRRELSAAQIERVKECKRFIGDIDEKTLQQSIDDLVRSAFPEENLQILEAMTKTYADLVAELGLDDRAKKEQLYSFIALNMAYLQFGGPGGKAGSEELYRRIRFKLRSYLPPEIFQNPDLFISLD